MLFLFAVGGELIGRFLAWLHLVVLGWLTMTALSVLVHAIPTFTETRWRGESLARASLVGYALGVAALVAAFWNQSSGVLPWAGGLVVAGLLGYLGPAAVTLVAAFRREALERAIARALLITLGCLLATALLGLSLTLALASGGPERLLVVGPPIHGSLGIMGWLTLLVMGVSTRTIRPITGARSRYAWVHRTTGSAVLLGTLALVAGIAFGAIAVEWIGAAVVAVGACTYVVDLVDILRRTTVRHRPPQVFVGAAAFWLIVGLVLAVGTLAGRDWAVAAVYLLLVGWLGQMVIGHLHHIGIRLIATIVRGDEDETPPETLLTEPLSWGAFILFQAATAVGAAGVLFVDVPLLESAAISGFGGWILMIFNVATAIRRARSQVIVVGATAIR